MYEVFVIACLLAHPADCRTFELRSPLYDDLRQCAHAAPASVTRWNMERKGWQVRKWTCARAGEST